MRRPIVAVALRRHAARIRQRRALVNEHDAEAMVLGQVDPDSMVNWTASGELVFVTILSGPGSVIAPFIGSTLFELLRTYAFEFLPQAWQLIVGGTLLAIILFLPGGVWSIVERLMESKNKS